MGLVTLTVNGRAYEVSCDDGQEEHLQALGSYLDDKTNELARNIGQVGEARLLLLAGLLVANDLHDTLTRLEEAEQAGGANVDQAAVVLESAAERVEALAGRLSDA